MPTKLAVHLIKKYGKTNPDLTQVPQVISRIELEILGSSPSKIFFIDYFPNELPEFLVLKNTYDTSYIKLC